MTRFPSAILMLILSAQCVASEGLVRTAGAAHNPFSTAMDMMMDAMDGYARKRTWEDALSGSGATMQPWAWGGMPGMTPQMPGQTQMQEMLQSAPGAAGAMGEMAKQVPASPLASPEAGVPGTASPFPSPSAATPFPGTGGLMDGVWQGSTGEVLVVRNGYCRIYASRDAYSDCRIAVQGNKAMLADPTSGQSRLYEYAVHEGRMALRDSEGNLLLYRRLPDTALRELLY